MGKGINYNYTTNGLTLYAVLMILFAAFLSIPFIFIPLITDQLELPGRIILLCVGIPMLWLMLRSAIRELYELRITVSNNTVSYEYSKAFHKTIVWQEPLGSYNALSRKIRHWGGSKSTSPIDYLDLLLVHKYDESKTVVLTTVRDDYSEFREKAREFSQQLDLPFVEEGNESVRISRGVDDFNKTISELKANGKIMGLKTSLTPFKGKTIKITESENGLTASTSSQMINYIGIVFLVLGILLAINTNQTSGSWLWPCILIVLGLSFSLMAASQTLIVSNGSISYKEWGLFLRNKKTTTILFSEIISIDLKLKYSEDGKKVLDYPIIEISKLEEKINFRGGSPEETKWLHNKLLAMVSNP